MWGNQHEDRQIKQYKQMYDTADVSIYQWLYLDFTQLAPEIIDVSCQI